MDLHKLGLRHFIINSFPRITLPTANIMGKTLRALVDSMPHLSSGTVHSADHGYEMLLRRDSTLARDEVTFNAIRGAVPERVALLRSKLAFDAAAASGCDVEDLSFSVARYCLVEPSYVVVLVPFYGTTCLDRFLMPLTKEEKQRLLHPMCSGPFQFPVVACLPSRAPSPDLSQPYRRKANKCPPGTVPALEDGSSDSGSMPALEDFARHSGDGQESLIIEETTEEVPMPADEEGRFRAGFRIVRRVYRLHRLYCFLCTLQMLVLLFSLW